MFAGRLVNTWILRDFKALRTAAFGKTLLVKSVRANRLLPWIVGHLPIRPPLVILRHPCAVVASQMSHGAWGDPQRPTAEKFLADFPKYREVFEKVETPEEILALTWAVDTFVPLASEHRSRFQWITYEMLRRDPVAELRPVFEAWGLPAPTSFGRAVHKKSRTTVGGAISAIDGWRQNLDDSQIRRILAVCGAFGLDFYSEDPFPDLTALGDPDLGRRLRGS